MSQKLQKNFCAGASFQYSCETFQESSFANFPRQLSVAHFTSSFFSICLCVRVIAVVPNKVFDDVVFTLQDFQGMFSHFAALCLKGVDKFS